LRIFLADDHAVVREGLKAQINVQPGMAVCGETGDGVSACEQVERLLPSPSANDYHGQPPRIGQVPHPSLVRQQLGQARSAG
jgi:hypothetical protein